MSEVGGRARKRSGGLEQRRNTYTEDHAAKRRPCGGRSWGRAVYWAVHWPDGDDARTSHYMDTTPPWVTGAAIVPATTISGGLSIATRGHSIATRGYLGGFPVLALRRGVIAL